MSFLLLVLSVVLVETKTALTSCLVRVGHLCISEMKYVIRVIWGNIRSSKCHSENYPFGELSFRGTVLRGTIRRGKVCRGSARRSTTLD